MKTYGPALLLSLTILALGLIIGLMPRDDTRVAVVAAPWSGLAGASHIIDAADGRILSIGRLPWIVVTDRGDQAFIDRLYSAGAWAVLDARAAQGCLPFAFSALPSSS